MGKEYEVITIDELTRLADIGGIEKYRKVRMKTKGGVLQTVDLNEADFTEEKAIPILTAAAKKADAIKASGG